MSHEKTEHDQIAGTELQWHGLNEVHETIGLRDPITNPIARRDVKATKLLTESGRDTGFKVLESTDDGLPVGLPFAKSYAPFTNGAFLTLAEAIAAKLEKLGVKYRIKSAGTVRARNLVFLSFDLEIDSNKVIIDGREFQQFLSLLNSFDKSCRITVKDSSICVVCSNTFHAALRDGNGAVAIAISHKPNAIRATADVPLIIEAAITGRKNLFRRLAHFAAFPVSLSDAEDIFLAFVQDVRVSDAEGEKGIIAPRDIIKAVPSARAANIAAKLTELFSKGKGNKGQTALDLFQAVTEYYTHFSSGKSEDKFRQVESSEFGDGSERKAEFFETLVNMTDVSVKYTAVARIGNTLLTNYRAAVKSKAEAKAKGE